MGARRIFSRGGQWGGLKDGSPPAGSRGSWWKSGGSWRKMMQKYFVYWGFRQHLQQNQKKTLFNISRRASAPPPCPCLRAPMPCDSLGKTPGEGSIHPRQPMDEQYVGVRARGTAVSNYGWLIIHAVAYESSLLPRQPPAHTVQCAHLHEPV